MVDRRTFLSGVAGLGAVTLLGCSEDETRPRANPVLAHRPRRRGGDELNPRVAGTIADGLNVPWGIAFLPNGDALVAQRDEGSIVRITTDGKVTTMGDVRGSVGQPGGEGGLLGLALDPDDDSALYAFVTTSRGRPRRAHRARRRPPRRHPPDPDRHPGGRPPPRRTAPVRPRGPPVRRHRRGGQPAGGAEEGIARRQGAPHRPQRRRRSTATRSATARGRTATATSRAWRSTPTAGSGPPSSARTGSTSST